MRERMTDTGPPGDEETPALAANRGFHESKRSAGPYSAAELSATGNHLGPGTAIIPLTQGQFAFIDSSEPFSDQRIATYLRFLARELSDDGVRAFLLASYGYNKFQKCGTPECRRYAWSLIQFACRLSAESRHSKTKATPSNAVLGQPGEAK